MTQSAKISKDLPYETIKTDVLVVGAGGAACRAALERAGQEQM